MANLFWDISTEQHAGATVDELTAFHDKWQNPTYHARPIANILQSARAGLIVIGRDDGNEIVASAALMVYDGGAKSTLYVEAGLALVAPSFQQCGVQLVMLELRCLMKDFDFPKGLLFSIAAKKKASQKNLSLTGFVVTDPIMEAVDSADLRDTVVKRIGHDLEFHLRRPELNETAIRESVRAHRANPVLVSRSVAGRAITMNFDKLHQLDLWLDGKPAPL